MTEMHIATHPARPVTVRRALEGGFASAHHTDPDVYLIGRARPHVEMTARKLSFAVEMARLTGRRG